MPAARKAHADEPRQIEQETRLPRRRREELRVRLPRANEARVEFRTDLIALLRDGGAERRDDRGAVGAEAFHG